MILRQYAIIIFSALLFFGCSDKPKNSSVQTNTPLPAVPEGKISVKIGPDNASKYSVIHIINDKKLPAAGNITWY